MEPRNNPASVTDVVLLSGGWESAGCLLMAMNELKMKSGDLRRLGILSVMYGQPYEAQERKAVWDIVMKLGLVPNMHVLEAVHIKRTGRIFVNRNAEFFRHAKLIYPNAANVWFGSRCPLAMFDSYHDSNPAWARATAGKLKMQAILPFTGWLKNMVRRYVVDDGIPEELIYSSEGYQYDAH